MQATGVLRVAPAERTRGVRALDLRGDVVMEPQSSEGSLAALRLTATRGACLGRREELVVRVHDGKGMGRRVRLTGKEAAIAFSPVVRFTQPPHVYGSSPGQVRATKEALGKPALALDAKASHRLPAARRPRGG